MDLLLLDKGLPDINGNEICHIVHQECRGLLLPIIMVVGTEDSETGIATSPWIPTISSRSPTTPSTFLYAPSLFS
ncbi:MAG: hypothetical protein PVI92_07925 [Chromatiales bacterium]